MRAPARQKVIAGNWKMNKTISQTVRFVDELSPLVQDAECKVFLAPPFTSLWHAAERAKHSRIVVGAQNISEHQEGAYTGEVSAKMVKDAGAQFVILGHSERRKLFHESSHTVSMKLKRALEESLQPIVCIGESPEEYEAGQTERVLKKQIAESLHGFQSNELETVILAYEPVWAIGTNQAATPEIAQKAHRFCRKEIAQLFGEKLARKLVILYGGSVKADNAGELLESEDIDGLLVGGASLTVDGFSKIVHYVIHK